MDGLLFSVDWPEKMQICNSGWKLWGSHCLSVCLPVRSDSYSRPDLCEPLLSVVPLISGEPALGLCSCWLYAGSRIGQDPAGRQTRRERDWVKGWDRDILYGSISADLKRPLANILHVSSLEATLALSSLMQQTYNTYWTNSHFQKN